MADSLMPWPEGKLILLLKQAEILTTQDNHEAAETVYRQLTALHEQRLKAVQGEKNSPNTSALTNGLAYVLHCYAATLRALRRLTEAAAVEEEISLLSKQEQ